MKPEAQRIAIAEADGWQWFPDYNRWATGADLLCRPHPGAKEALSVYDLPDYLNDLNAIHEAENRLTKHQRISHGKILQELLNETAVGYVSDFNSDMASLSRIASAPCPIRAEALLRVIGRWEDGK